jgi:hypothetical protein
MTPEESLAKWKCCASLEEHKEHLARNERLNKEAYEARKKNLAGLPSLIKALGGNPDAPSKTPVERAVEAAGFRVANDMLGQPTLWCKECARDGGFHWENCSKSGKKEE